MAPIRTTVAALLVVSTTGLLSSLAHYRLTDPLCMVDRKAPSVFLLGVQKSGTSSLWHDLTDRFEVASAHPVYNEPSYRNKEIAFFNDLERYKKGRAFYLRHFPKCNEMSEYEKSIDASPNALFVEGTAQRMKDFYGDASNKLRFVVIMRDPASRMESAYHQFNAGVDHDFDTYVAKTISQARAWAKGNGPAPQPNLYAGSMYAKNLKPFMDLFDKNQFALVTLRQYQSRPNATMSFIGDRIGMKMKRDIGRKASVSVHAYDSDHPKMQDATRKLLNQFFAPYDKELEAMMREDGMSPTEHKPYKTLWEDEKENVGKKPYEEREKTRGDLAMMAIGDLMKSGKFR